MYEIKKGVPVPDGYLEGPKGDLTRTMASLEVGDCFDIPIKPGARKQSIQANVGSKAKRLKIRIVTRSIIDDQGTPFMRVWRAK